MSSTNFATPSFASLRDEKSPVAQTDQKLTITRGIRTLSVQNDISNWNADIRRVIANCADKSGMRRMFDTAFSCDNMSPVSRVSDLPYGLIYRPGKQNIESYGIHRGQRKLFYAEVKFLLHAFRYVIDHRKTTYVVYAGAAPNRKGLLLSKLFPSFVFVFVDPNSFAIAYGNKKTSENASHEKVIHLKMKNPREGRDFDEKANENYFEAIMAPRNANRRIFLIEDFMSADLARNLSQLQGNILFISDLRTNTSGTKVPLEFDICCDNALVFVIMNILNPMFSSLKHQPLLIFDAFNERKVYDIGEARTEVFVLARDEFGVNFLQNYANRIATNPVGDIHLQAWAGVSSLETRIWVHGENNRMVTGNDPTFADKLNFFNCVYRSWYHFANPFANDALDFGNCYACASEYRFYRDYCYIMRPEETEEDNMLFVNAMLRDLRSKQCPGEKSPGSHNCFYSTHPSDRLNKIEG